MKKRFNVYMRICLLVMIISIIWISYTLYYAFTHNGEVTYQNFGINQVISVDPTLTFIQILVLFILIFTFVASIVFIFYTKGGKISPEEEFKSNEKSMFYIIETVLFTILLTLIIVIPTNIILENTNQTSNNNINSQSNGNAIVWNR